MIVVLVIILLLLSSLISAGVAYWKRNALFGTNIGEACDIKTDKIGCQLPLKCEQSICRAPENTTCKVNENCQSPLVCDTDSMKCQPAAVVYGGGGSSGGGGGSSGGIPLIYPALTENMLASYVTFDYIQNTDHSVTVTMNTSDFSNILRNDTEAIMYYRAYLFDTKSDPNMSSSRHEGGFRTINLQPNHSYEMTIDTLTSSGYSGKYIGIRLFLDSSNIRLFDGVSSQSDRTLSTFVHVEIDYGQILSKYGNNGLANYITRNNEQTSANITVRLNISDGLPAELEGIDLYQTHFYIKYFNEQTNGAQVSQHTHMTAPHTWQYLHAPLTRGGTITYTTPPLSGAQKTRYFATFVQIVFGNIVLYDSGWSVRELHVIESVYVEPTCDMVACNEKLYNALITNSENRFGITYDDNSGEMGGMPPECDHCNPRGYQYFTQFYNPAQETLSNTKHYTVYKNGRRTYHWNDNSDTNRELLYNLLTY